MHFWLASLILILMPVFAVGQSVTVPAQIRGVAGAWVVVTPKVDGGIPRWRVDPGLEEVDLSLLFPPEILAKMKGKVFTSPVDGKFKLELWNAKADLASDIATCWVVIGKGATPIPPLEPKAKSLTFLVIGPTLKTAQITDDAGFRAWLKANGVGIFGISLKAQQDANPKFAGISSPSIVLQDQDNNVIAHNPIVANTTVEDAKSFVTRYLR